MSRLTTVCKLKEDEWKCFCPFVGVILCFKGSFQLAMETFDEAIGYGMISRCPYAFAPK